MSLNSQSTSPADSSSVHSAEIKLPVADHAALPLSVVLIDPHSAKFVEVDQSICRRLGYQPAELIHHAVRETHPELGARALQEIHAKLQARRNSLKFYTHQESSTGEKLDAFVTASLSTRDGRPMLQLVTVDVSARLRAERALRETEKRFRATFEQSAVGIAHVALDGNFLRVNRKFRQILGYAETQLHHLTLANISHPNDMDIDWAQGNALLRGEIATYSIEKRLLRKGGGTVWVNLTNSLVHDEAGGPDYMVHVVEDIAARKRAELERDELLRTLEERVSQRTVELERLTMTDALTGIANRRHFDTALTSEWARAARSGRTLSLILVDIDDFKLLNDSLGHIEGDGIIKTVANAVQQVACRSSDLGARYGGDEFAIVLPETEEAGAVRLAEKLRQLVLPLSWADASQPGLVQISVSQGIAVAVPSHEKSATDLLLAADRALYTAKQLGNGQISVVSDI